MAKGMLDSAGIQSFLADDNTVRMDWFISNFIGGVKLRVRESEVEAAERVLSEATPDVYEVEGLGEFQVPHCPRCASKEVRFEGVNKSIGLVSAYAGVPVPIPVNEWVCESCGNRWKEEEPTESDAS